MSIRKINGDKYDDVSRLKVQKQKLNYLPYQISLISADETCLAGYTPPGLTESAAVLTIRDAGGAFLWMNWWDAGAQAYKIWSAVAHHEPPVFQTIFTDWKSERSYFEGEIASCVLIYYINKKYIGARIGFIGLVTLIEG